MLKKRYDLFFSTLSNINRLIIIQALTRDEMNVNEIVEETRLNQTTVSHNLQKLRKSGLVTVKRVGKFKLYKINHDTIGPLMELIDRHIDKYC